MLTIPTLFITVTKFTTIEAEGGKLFILNLITNSFVPLLSRHKAFYPGIDVNTDFDTDKFPEPVGILN